MNPEVVAVFPPFSGLDPDSARLLEGAVRISDIAAGTTLFRDGGECTAYVLVIDGAIRVQKVAENGREIVLYRVEAGQSCVLTTNCLISHKDYAAEGIAETAVRVLTMPSAVFRTLLGRSETFRDFVFSAYASRIADLLLLIEEVAFGRIDVRLSTWLRQHGGESGEIRATHHEIAVELGTAREVISRQLKDFERRGWVRLHRGRIDIHDPHGLGRLNEAM